MFCWLQIRDIYAPFSKADHLEDDHVRFILGIVVYCTYYFPYMDNENNFTSENPAEFGHSYRSAPGLAMFVSQLRETSCNRAPDKIEATVVVCLSFLRRPATSELSTKNMCTHSNDVSSLSNVSSLGTSSSVCFVPKVDTQMIRPTAPLPEVHVICASR